MKMFWVMIISHSLVGRKISDTQKSVRKKKCFKNCKLEFGLSKPLTSNIVDKSIHREKKCMFISIYLYIYLSIYSYIHIYISKLSDKCFKDCVPSLSRANEYSRVFLFSP